MKALVVDFFAANALVRAGANFYQVSAGAVCSGVHRACVDDIVYLVGVGSSASTRLFVVSCEGGIFLRDIPTEFREEAGARALRAALSQFQPGLVKIPLDWNLFHNGSLLSFHSNRFQTSLNARFYFDLSPEGTNHVYLFHCELDSLDELTRQNYNSDLFIEACIGYDELHASGALEQKIEQYGHKTIDLSDVFAEIDITQGAPFSVWRDVKLTRAQRAFFDAPFEGPLRVRGPAGSGKTLALAMRFLKEFYSRIDNNESPRGCFIALGEETVSNIQKYLLQIDERGLLFGGGEESAHYMEITTFHGLGYRFISRDTDNIRPISLDGTEGRILQSELVRSIVEEYKQGVSWSRLNKDGLRSEFFDGLNAENDSSGRRAFVYNLLDEFASVLEALGARNSDEIAAKYMRARPYERAVAKNANEKSIVIEFYYQFRLALQEMNVFSLDHFTADFLSYLNSFRWEALRPNRGFDFVFADELHLFNAQERRSLGYLLRTPKPPHAIAVAYDPRQSPRNTFFPDSRTEKDAIWSEAGLDSSRPFELNDVFRYTPQILKFLQKLNEHFPANDLAEDWQIKFGQSYKDDGPLPIVKEFSSKREMAKYAAERCRNLLTKVGRGEHVALLCIDHSHFEEYKTAGLFSDKFIAISGRDELGSIERYRTRVIISMPEYVAGLQFKSVVIIDANADQIAEMGGGITGLHRFVSSMYLGASRAMLHLEILADLSSGGLAAPLKEALKFGVVAQ